MGWVIVFIIVVVLGIYLISFIFAALPIWGPTLLVTYITFITVLIWKHAHLKDPKVLSRLLSVTIKGERLDWGLDDSSISSYSSSELPCIIAGTAVYLYIVTLIIKNPGTKAVKFLYEEISPSDAVTIYSILSAVIVIVAMVMTKPNKIIRESIKKKIYKLIGNYEADIASLNDLYAAESAVFSLASDMGLSFPTSYLDEIKEYASAHKEDLLESLDELSVLIRKKQLDADEDLKCLSKAKQDLIKTLTYHKKASDEIICSGSILLIRQMEDLLRGLQSDGLKKILEQKKWSDYHIKLDQATRLMEKNVEAAKNYKQTGRQDGNEDPTGKMTLEKAYKTVGLKPTVPNEHVKDARRLFARLYHTDKNVSDDEKRLAVINQALDLIEEARGIK